MELCVVYGGKHKGSWYASAFLYLFAGRHRGIQNEERSLNKLSVSWPERGLIAMEEIVANEFDRIQQAPSGIDRGTWPECHVIIRNSFKAQRWFIEEYLRFRRGLHGLQEGNAEGVGKSSPIRARPVVYASGKEATPL